MKPSKILSPLACTLSALILFAATTSYGLDQVWVKNAVSPTPVELCADELLLTTEISHLDSDTEYIYQQFPVGCAVTAFYFPSPCPAVTPTSFTDGNSGKPTVEYKIVGQVNPCTVIAQVTIPCSVGVLPQIIYPDPVTPIDKNGTTHFNPTYLFPATPFPFQVQRPVMHFKDFVDDIDECIPCPPNVPLNICNGGTVVPAGQFIDHDPPTQKFIVSPPGTFHTRQYDLFVSAGTIQSLSFCYTPAANITPISFTLQGVANNGPHGTPIGSPSAPIPVPSNQIFPFVIPINAGTLVSLFAQNGHKMGLFERIRIVETFIVNGCAKADGSATSYSIIWNNCPGSTACVGGAGCNNSETIFRHTEVVAATGDFTPGIHFENGNELNFCQGTPSDVIVSFSNAGADTSATAPGYPCGDDGVPGSARRTLHTIRFHFKQDVFSQPFLPANILLEGTGGTPVPLSSLPTAFYTYSGQPNYLVTLNFDVLTTQWLGPNGPLQNNLIPNAAPKFNQIDDGKSVALRFKNAQFDCANARFYPDSSGAPGFRWDSYPKPDIGLMFFGDGDDTFNCAYDDMCGTPHQQSALWGNFFNNFPVEVAAEAASTTQPRAGTPAMFPGDRGQIDFQWVYVGGEPSPSPFAFEPPRAPGSFYFNCKPRYEATLLIPIAYTLTKATYYVDPRRTPTGTPGNLWTGTTQTTGASDYNFVTPTLVTIGNRQYYSYTFQAPLNSAMTPTITLSGHIVAEVQLAPSCVNSADPDWLGGLDNFTAQIVAYCDGCTGCPDTIAIVSGALDKHCHGACWPGSAPQNTTSFTYNRLTFGTVPGTTTTVTPGPGIEAQRAYPCDRLEFVVRGVMNPTPNAALALRMTFQPPPSAPPAIDFQFLDYEFATVTATANGLTTTYSVAPTDLGNVFNSLGSGWNFNGNFASGTVVPCEVFLNFLNTAAANTAFFNALHGASTLDLEVHLFVRVKPMGGGFTPGNYPLLIQGQFVVDPSPAQNTTYVPSCDPYWAFLQVLGVKNVPFANIQESRSDEVCDRPFEYGIEFVGGLRGLPEFENEARPQCYWPPEIDMQLPLGLHWDAAHYHAATFTVLDAGNNLPNGFPQPDPVDAGFRAIVSVVPATSTVGEKMKFTGYDDGTQHPWPLVTKDGTARGLRVYGWLRNDCPPTTPPDIKLDWQFTAQYYAASPCRFDNTAPFVMPWGTPLPQPHLSMVFDPGQSVATANPTRIGGLTLTYDDSDPTLRGTTVHDVWIKIISPGVVVNSILVNPLLNPGQTPIQAVDGYFNVGRVAEGPMNAAHIVLNDVSIQNCHAGFPYILVVAYGYWCAGMPHSVADANKACFQDLYPLSIKLETSALGLEVIPPDGTIPGDSCTPFDYRARLYSEAFGTVRFPRLTLNLPNGMMITSAKCQATDSGGTGPLKPLIHVTPSLGSAGLHVFDVDLDAYGGTGIPGTGAYLDCFFTVNVSCGGLGIPGLVFSASGYDLCEPLPAPPQVSTPPPNINFSGTTTVPQLYCPPGMALTCIESTDPSHTGYATALDKCGKTLKAAENPELFAYTDTPVHCGIDRAWTVTICGVALPPCVQHLTFPQDTTPPTISTCPPDRILVPDRQNCQALMPDLTGELIASDNCKVVSIIQTPPKDTPLSPGVHTVLFLVCDACGNCTPCTSQVTVTALTGFANTPTDITVPCQDDLGAVVNYETPFARSLCCIGPSQVTCSPPSGYKFPIGVTRVTCTAVDPCGLSTVYTFNVTVAGHGPGRWAWAKKASGVGTDSGNAVAVDRDGNVFVTGSYTADAGGFTFPSSTITLPASVGSDIFLAKYDGAGMLLWAVNAGGPGQDAGYGVAVDSDGNAYVTGAFGDTAVFHSTAGGPALSKTSTGGLDAFIAMYDADGKCVWVERDGDSVGNDQGNGIAVTRSSNGNSADVFVVGNWTVAGGIQQAFVRQLQSAGGLVTKIGPPVISTTIGAGGFAQGTSIAVDSAESVYVAGYYADTAAFAGSAPLPAPGGNGGIVECFFAAFAPGGVPGGTASWVRHAGYGWGSAPSCTHAATGIAVDDTGHGFLTGVFSGTANFGVNGNGQSVSVTSAKAGYNNNPATCAFQLFDYFVAKFDAASGTPQWAVKGGGPANSDDETYGIAVGPDGNPVVTGFLYPGAPINSVANGASVLVACYDSAAGAVRWVNNATDGPIGVPPAADIGLGVAINSAGSIHVTGAFSQDLQFPPVGLPVATLNSGTPTVQDMFVARLSPACECERQLVPPANIVTDCLGDSGVRVSFTLPTVTSQCCAPVVLTSSPQSGDTFPIGVTTVTCTALDACGHISVCTFTVTVRGHGPGDWKWASQGGGTARDSGNSVAVDARGNVFVTGGFSSDTMTFPNSAISLFATSPVSDMFLAKYDAFGTLLWAVSAGGTLIDAGNGVTVDADGNAYVTGGFTGTASFGTFTLTSDTGSRDVFVAKYSPSGACLWAARSGGKGDDYGSGIAWTPIGANGGTVFIAGSWGSANSPNAQQAFVLAVTDVGLATPGLGTMMVSSPVAADIHQSAKARAVAVDGAGNVYITGPYGGPEAGTRFGSTVSVPANPFSRIFVVKFDNNLTPLLATHSGYTAGVAASGGHDGTGIAIDPAGSYCYVTAYFYGLSGVPGTANFGANKRVTSGKYFGNNGDQISDYLIAQFNLANLTPNWVIKGGGNPDSNDETSGIAVSAFGNPCVTGFLHPAALNNGVQEGSMVLAASYSSSGSPGPLWIRNATDGPGGPKDPQDVGLGIALDRAGCVHITGAFTEDLKCQPVATLNSVPASQRDMFVEKICPVCFCVPASIVSDPVDQFASYPATFTATFAGSVTSCGWYRNGVLLNPGGGTGFFPPCYEVNVQGNVSTLTLTCVPSGVGGDTGVYSFVASSQDCNDSGATSAGARIYYIVVWDPHVDEHKKFHMTIDVPPGVAYQVEYRNDLSSGTNWLVLTNAVGTGTNILFTDPNPNPTQRFYRVVPQLGR